MDPWARIEARFEMAIPPLYRKLHNARRLDSTSPKTCIAFTDHTWLNVDQIAGFEFADWQTLTRPWFVPFSISGRHDHWGWRRDWMAGGQPAVAFCERGPEGIGFAPDFQGFLYRMLLEELSGTWLMDSVDDAAGRSRIQQSIDIICPHLPSVWADRIHELSRRPWSIHDDETICVFPRSECEDIVSRDLAFDHLDEPFEQEAEAST